MSKLGIFPIFGFLGLLLEYSFGLFHFGACYCDFKSLCWQETEATCAHLLSNAKVVDGQFKAGWSKVLRSLWVVDRGAVHGPVSFFCVLVYVSRVLGFWGLGLRSSNVYETLIFLGTYVRVTSKLGIPRSSLGEPLAMKTPM